MNADFIIDKIHKVNESAQYNKRVRKTLNTISGFCMRSTGKKNAWVVNSREFFIEWPLFGEDSEYIYGTIYERVGKTSRKAGNYKIGVDGNILEFPFLPPNVANRINSDDSSNR